MIIFALIIWSIIFCVNEGEVPRTICTSPRPFKTSYNTCANFTEICLKSADEDCNSFMSICQTCPASNMTVILLREIIDFNNEMNNKLTNKMTGTITMTVLIFILYIVSIFCFAWKLGWIKRGNVQTKRKNKYMSIGGEEGENSIRLLDRENSIENSTRVTNIEAFQQIQQGIVVKIQISGTPKTIEIYVNNQDCVISVKKKICSLWSFAQPHYYKIMKLIYNEMILEDNQYLLPLIDSKNALIKCQIDRLVDHKQIVVFCLRGDVCVPNCLQMKINQRISELREFISRFVKDSNFMILKNNKILEDESTLEDCGINDSDWIKFIKEHQGTLEIKSIFEKKVTIRVKYFNTDLISTIIQTAANEFHADPNNFVLFLYGEYLVEESRACEYDIKDDSPVEFYCLRRLNDITVIGDPIDYGYFSQLYRAKDKLTQEEILILKYNDLIVHSKKNFLKQLITLQIRDSIPGFLKVIGVYKNEDTIYVAIENMELGSLTMFLKENKNISEGQIKKWSKQILECLKYLHSTNIYYIDLKPFELMIDKNRDLKLLSFNITTFKNEDEKDETKKRIKEFENENVSNVYLAPEIENGSDFNEKMDIWSFGVTLIHIVNGEPPELHWHENLQRFQYTLRDRISDNLKGLIDSCVQKDPNLRPTIDQLLQHKFLKYFN